MDEDTQVAGLTATVMAARSKAGPPKAAAAPKHSPPGQRAETPAGTPAWTQAGGGAPSSWWQHGGGGQHGGAWGHRGQGSGSTWQGAPAGSSADGGQHGGDWEHRGQGSGSTWQDAPAGSSAGGKGKGGQHAPAGSSAGSKGKRGKGAKRSRGDTPAAQPAAQPSRRKDDECLQVACKLTPVQIRQNLPLHWRKELGLPIDGDPTIAFVSQAKARGVKFTYRMRKGREYATAYLMDEMPGEPKDILHEIMMEWFDILEACGEDLTELRLPAFYGLEGQLKQALPWFKRLVKGQLHSPAAGSTAGAGSTASAGSADRVAPQTMTKNDSFVPSRWLPSRPTDGDRSMRPPTQYVVFRADDVSPSIRGDIDKTLKAKQIMMFRRGYSLHVSTTGITTKDYEERGAPQANGPAQVEWKAWIRTIPESAASLVWNAPEVSGPCLGVHPFDWGSSTGVGAAG